MGFTCRLQKPVKSKIIRFAPFSSVAQAGFVQVVEGDWNKEFFDELEVFDGEGKFKDDQVDAVSDCFSILNKNTALPTFSLADFTSAPAFADISSGNVLPVSGMTLPSTIND